MKLVFRLGRGGGEVSQSTLDGFRDGVGSGEVGTLGLESILVGDVCELDVATIFAGVGELALNLQGRLFSTNVLQGSFLVGSNTVAGFVRPLVGAIGVDLALLLHDGDGLSGSLGSGEGDSQETEKDL